MKQLEHLQVYDLVLTTRSPLFVGSGTTYPSNNNTFHPGQKKGALLDKERFFQMLLEQKAVDQYERFVLSGSTKLDSFLREVCQLTPEQIRHLYRCSANTTEVVENDHLLNEICSFVRGSDGAAYIPGGSLKGAFRTAVLLELMQKEKKGTWPQHDAKKRDRSMARLEGCYLNTLHLKKDKDHIHWANDAVNSLFRGVLLSDSQPISDQQMILCGKKDIDLKGRVRSTHLLRECVKPGTKISFQLTLDTSVLKGRITAETLRRSIQIFSHYYQIAYISKFPQPKNACAIRYENTLILGGGSGFFAKSLAYPYLGAEEGLRYVSCEMQQSFKEHRHEEDMALELSPHTMKYTQYDGQLYPYGVCEVTIA